jgi:hypothetical protein
MNRRSDVQCTTKPHQRIWKIEVAAVDPLASMQSIQNKELQVIAKEIQLKLKKVIEQL